MASPEARQILINDFGYQPVDIESKSGYSRAVKETIVKLENSNPNDSRISILQDAIRPSRKKTTQPKKTKDDAVKFIRGKGAPAPVTPPAAPMPKFGGEKTGAALATISQNVNAIKKLVTRQNKLEKDKADDTREAREKKKRSMKENLLEGGKKMYDKVAGAFGKVLEPAKGIFESIFNFLKLFILGAGLMKLLDWFGDSGNKGKIESIFRFLKDWWPVLVAGLMALFPGVALIPGVIALAVGFLPKLIKTVKSIFGLGKTVDDELKKGEKDLEKGGTGGEATIETGTDVKPEETKPETGLRTTGEETKGENLQQPQSFNQGGEVPGQGNTDTVPAMLTPGEFVLTKEAVNQVGADTLYNMNAAAGGVGKPSQQKQAQKKKKKTSTVGTMMNMGGVKMGGMTNNMSYGSGGVVNNMSYAGGGQVPTQNFFLGGLVKKVGGLISKTPQARLIKFAANQVKKAGVKPPVAKALKALKSLGMTNTPPSPMPEGGDSSVNEIPRFSVVASGGRAKEQTLGIRR